MGSDEVLMERDLRPNSAGVTDVANWHDETKVFLPNHSSFSRPEIASGDEGKASNTANSRLYPHSSKTISDRLQPDFR